jgi:hypothetical protein
MSEDETTKAVMDVAENDADGVTSDEPALGGVGMALDALGPHDVIIVASIAVRRLAAARRGSVTA